MFSKLKEIVHCGVILVTLLAKASMWADPEGSFQVLSARLELCHSSPSRQSGPSLSTPGGRLTHSFLPLPTTREWAQSAQRWTHTYTQMLTLTLWPTSIFTTPFSELQPMVYFPAVHSHSEHQHPCPPLSVFFSPLPPPSWRLPGSTERLHTHTHTPHDASEGFPDVLV